MIDMTTKEFPENKSVISVLYLRWQPFENLTCAQMMNASLLPKLSSKRRVVNKAFIECDGQQSAVSNDMNFFPKTLFKFSANTILKS